MLLWKAPSHAGELALAVVVLSGCLGADGSIVGLYRVESDLIGACEQADAPVTSGPVFLLVENYTCGHVVFECNTADECAPDRTWFTSTPSCGGLRLPNQCSCSQSPTCTKTVTHWWTELTGGGEVTLQLDERRHEEVVTLATSDAIECRETVVYENPLEIPGVEHRTILATLTE